MTIKPTFKIIRSFQEIGNHFPKNICKPSAVYYGRFMLILGNRFYYYAEVK